MSLTVREDENPGNIENINLEELAGLSVSSLMAVRDLIEEQIATNAHDEISSIEETINLLTARKNALVERYGMPKQAKKAKKANGKPSTIKFRHPETGQTWTGRGKPPGWIIEARNVYDESELLA